MKCENCGNNEANIKYTQIINGVKKEMHLCEECGRDLGIATDLNFNMSMDIPSFFGEIFNEYNSLNILPSFSNLKEDKCKICGMTYVEFSNTGKFGCESCYDIFSYRLDPILKSIQGNNRHVGRKSRRIHSNIVKKMEEKKEELKSKQVENDKVTELKNQLKKAVKEERYEDAAKLRDEINILENKKDENN